MTIYGREIRPEDLPVIGIDAEGAIFDELDCLDLSHLETSNINLSNINNSQATAAKKECASYEQTTELEQSARWG